MKEIEELKKGCGKLEFGTYTRCGKISILTHKKIICSSCKAELKGFLAGQNSQKEKDLNGLLPIIAHLETCMEDDFERFYISDCRSVLRELKELKQKIKGDEE